MFNCVVENEDGEEKIIKRNETEQNEKKNKRKRMIRAKKGNEERKK